MKHYITSLFIVGALFNTAPTKAQTNSNTAYTQDLRTIEERFPEIFTSRNPQHPDTAYELGKKTTGFLADFPGETGKTQFYLLYAQHLQKLNKHELAANCRPKIIQLYQSINRLNQLIDIKVGYYDQMQTLLIAYAEYAMIEIQQIDASKYANADVNKQKKLFIKSIQQKVKTKNLQLNLNSKPNFNKNQELINQEINKIEELITDNFLLKSSQVFHYTYY